MITDKTKPHAIFLDIDGTLMKQGYAFSSDAEFLAPCNAKMIEKARKAGHRVLINTGRGKSFLPALAMNSIEWDGIIAGLGAYVECEGKVIYNNSVSREHLSELVDFIIKNKKPCRFQGDRCLCHEPGRRTDGVWQMFYTKQEFFELLGDGYVSKITIDYDLSGEYLELLRKLFNVYEKQGCGEAVEYGCDKASGMQKALDYFGIPRENSISMGDDINDTEAFLFAGTSVAMGNAIDELKKKCDFVTKSDIDGGVGYAIEKLLF